MGSDSRHIGFWLGAFVALLLGLAVFKDILLPFVAGMMLAYFLNPLADRLQARGMSRTLAAALIVGAVGAVTIAGIVLLAPLLAAQIQQLATSLPGDIQRARGAIEAMARERLGSHAGLVQTGIDRAIAELQSSWGGILSSVAATLWNRGAALINVMSILMITPLVVFYLLVDWHPMIERVRSWLPRDHAPTIERLAGEINDAVAAFIRGQGGVCLCLGLFYAIALSALGLNYGALVGLATGVMAFVPMVGWATGLAISTLIALLQFAPTWTPVLGVVGIMAAGMALDTAVLSPRLVGQKVGLHPVWLIFALFAFSLLFGFVGTLIAVPVSAAIAVLARFAIARYLESDVYRGHGRAVLALKPGTKPTQKP
jgi:predicted PurR-regulated permease PerM